MLPATVGLIVLREPLVQLLFERGRFGEVETRGLPWCSWRTHPSFRSPRSTSC